MASKGYEPEWRKKIRRAAQRAARWLRVERKRLEGLPVEERKRLEELRVEWETAKSKGFPFGERKRLEELRVEWEAAKRAAKKLMTERAQRWAAVDALHREKEFKKRLKKLGTPTAWARYEGRSSPSNAKRRGRKKWTVGQQITKAVVFDSMVVDALAEAVARRILTIVPGAASTAAQSKRRKVMVTEETVEEASLSPILCPIPKAAMLIGRGVSFIYDAIATGKIKAVKSDKRTLVIVKSLHEYVRKLDDAVIKPQPKRAHHRRKKNPQPSIPPQKRAETTSA